MHIFRFHIFLVICENWNLFTQIIHGKEALLYTKIYVQLSISPFLSQIRLAVDNKSKYNMYVDYTNTLGVRHHAPPPM